MVHKDQKKALEKSEAFFYGIKLILVFYNPQKRTTTKIIQKKHPQSCFPRKEEAPQEAQPM